MNSKFHLKIVKKKKDKGEHMELIGTHRTFFKRRIRWKDMYSHILKTLSNYNKNNKVVICEKWVFAGAEEKSRVM